MEFLLPLWLKLSTEAENENYSDNSPLNVQYFLSVGLRGRLHRCVCSSYLPFAFKGKKSTNVSQAYHNFASIIALFFTWENNLRSKDLTFLSPPPFFFSLLEMNPAILVYPWISLNNQL